MILQISEYYTSDSKTISDQKYVFPDEDFCLYKKFPHEHLVFPYFSNCYNSCLFNWLIQYRDRFQLDSYFLCVPTPTDCNTSIMLSLCDHISFNDTFENQNILQGLEYYFDNPMFVRQLTQYILLVICIWQL